MTYRNVRMVPGNLHFIWQFHPKRKLSNSSAILNQAQDGHFCIAIFFEEQHASELDEPKPV
jgi:hypothetical protein